MWFDVAGGATHPWSQLTIHLVSGTLAVLSVLEACAQSCAKSGLQVGHCLQLPPDEIHKFLNACSSMQHDKKQEYCRLLVLESTTYVFNKKISQSAIETTEEEEDSIETIERGSANALC